MSVVVVVGLCMCFTVYRYKVVEKTRCESESVSQCVFSRSNWCKSFSYRATKIP